MYWPVKYFSIKYWANRYWAKNPSAITAALILTLDDTNINYILGTPLHINYLLVYPLVVTTELNTELII